MSKVVRRTKASLALAQSISGFRASLALLRAISCAAVAAPSVAPPLSFSASSTLATLVLATALHNDFVCRKYLMGGHTEAGALCCFGTESSSYGRQIELQGDAATWMNCDWLHVGSHAGPEGPNGYACKHLLLAWQRCSTRWLATNSGSQLHLQGSPGHDWPPGIHRGTAQRRRLRTGAALHWAHARLPALLATATARHDSCLLACGHTANSIHGRRFSCKIRAYQHKTP